MSAEPPVRSLVAFVDGQNLYHAAKTAFGYTFPNYDVLKLSKKLAGMHNWELRQVRFYTGVPEIQDDAHWHHFWEAKLLRMSRQGVHVFSRALRYRNHRITLPDGSRHAFMVAEEKGIDVRLAIDVIRMAHHGVYDVALIFSQDQDLSEVADEIRIIAREQKRWIKVASAFPVSPVAGKQRGINKTDWMPIDRSTYDSCLDPNDYRMPRAGK